MNICEEAIKVWPDGAAREYLDSQSPDDEEVKWVVMDESGLYGYIDSSGDNSVPSPKRWLIQAGRKQIGTVTVIEFVFCIGY